jgi:hypothetical protein
MKVIVDDIARTPNIECPACHERRIHKQIEWQTYHPLAGKGVDNRDNKSIKKVVIK